MTAALVYRRTVIADDEVIAQGSVVALATAEGYRVVSVDDCRFLDYLTGSPRYTVTLTVESKG